MTTLTLVQIILVIVLAVFLISIIWLRKSRMNRTPNFRALFILGLTWLPMGLISDITVLWTTGLIFFIIGIANRKKWDQSTRWTDLSPREKKIKLTFLFITSFLMIIFLLLYFFVI